METKLSLNAGECLIVTYNRPYGDWAYRCFRSSVRNAKKFAKTVKNGRVYVCSNDGTMLYGVL